jgi:hypothetical protein
VLPTQKPDNAVGLAGVATRHNEPVPAHVEQNISDSIIKMKLDIKMKLGI